MSVGIFWVSLPLWLCLWEEKLLTTENIPLFRLWPKTEHNSQYPPGPNGVEGHFFPSLKSDYFFLIFNNIAPHFLDHFQILVFCWKFFQPSLSVTGHAKISHTHTNTHTLHSLLPAVCLLLRTEHKTNFYKEEIFVFCSLLYTQHLEMCPRQNAEWMNGQARASWPISYSTTWSCIFHLHHRFFQRPLTHSWCQRIPTSIPETWKASQTIKPHACPRPLFKCGCGPIQLIWLLLTSVASSPLPFLLPLSRPPRIYCDGSLISNPHSLELKG